MCLVASSCISVGESEVALAPLWINNNPKGEHNVRPGVALATCLCCLTILQLNRCCRTILLESLLSTAVYPRIGLIIFGFGVSFCFTFKLYLFFCFSSMFISVKLMFRCF
ncbi:unnamed protein product [Brassica oleracea]|uniref:(rape) hypothetical protein n=1 Tax=Brassica napus TaxID=3708 RepID=A0A816JKZ4_BRANA|nr:unnamed protein product [Brassica napus]